MPRPTKEYQAFTHLVDRLLAVPRAAIVERMAAHRDQAAQNPRRRGPKAKTPEPSASAPPQPTPESDS